MKYRITFDRYFKTYKVEVKEWWWWVLVRVMSCNFQPQTGFDTLEEAERFCRVIVEASRDKEKRESEERYVFIKSFKTNY